MTNTYLTGNPLGSALPKDLSDNASNLDDALHLESPAWFDRFGKRRETWFGIEQQVKDYILSNGYTWVGDYVAGLVFTSRNQYTVVDGVAYGLIPGITLPYTTTGSWATESSNFRLLTLNPERLYTPFYPESYKAKGDARRVPAFFCTAGNPAVTVSAGGVTIDDIGKKLVLPNAGVLNNAHVSTVIAVSGTQVTLQEAPVFSVAGADSQDGIVGTDDTQAWVDLLADIPIGAMLNLTGRYLLLQPLTTTKALNWQGGADAALIFATTDGLSVDRREEDSDQGSRLMQARYENFTIVTCTQPGFNLTAMRLMGPVNSGNVFRTHVDGVALRGISGGFILRTAWGNGLQGYNISTSYLGRVSVEGLAIDSTKPGAYYGIQVINSTYVVIDNPSVSFCTVSVEVVGGQVTPYGLTSGTESIICRDGHLVFCDYGYRLSMVSPTYGGTFFRITGCHMDSFVRNILIAADGAQAAQTQVDHNKLHMNLRTDYAADDRWSIEARASLTSIHDNEILYYLSDVPGDSTHRGGVILGINGESSGIVNNSFVHCTKACVDVSNVPTGQTVTVALNRQGPASGTINDAHSVARQFGNTWN